MNQEQAKSMVRWVVTASGGALAGWAAARGWVDANTVMSILNSETFIGLAASGVSLVWGLFAHTSSNSASIVAAMPDDVLHTVGVARVYTTPDKVGDALANLTPGNVVVPIGTGRHA